MKDGSARRDIYWMSVRVVERGLCRRGSVDLPTCMLGSLFARWHRASLRMHGVFNVRDGCVASTSMEKGHLSKKQDWDKIGGQTCPDRISVFSAAFLTR
jgi:hypothetical protein